jgi:hypothetical protein
MDAITSFSYKPLRLSFGLFSFSIATSALLMLAMLIVHSPVATAVLGMGGAVFFLGGLLFLSMGILGEYVGRVYDEVRYRPLSLISQVHRSDEEAISTPVGMIAVKPGSFAVPGGLRSGDDITRAA